MKVAIIAGHTASGKSTVLEEMCEKHDFIKLITTTTRDPRPGEIDGIHYYFISKNEFKEKIANNEFLEHVEIKGNFYGSSLSEFKKDLNGKKPIMILDPVGTKEAVDILKSEGHNPVSIFIDESPDTCIERVLSRPATDIEKNKRVYDIENVESGWSTYMDYDFKTTPKSTLEKNCLDVLNFINQEEPTIRVANKKSKRIKP